MGKNVQKMKISSQALTKYTGKAPKKNVGGPGVKKFVTATPAVSLFGNVALSPIAQQLGASLLTVTATANEVMPDATPWQVSSEKLTPIADKSSPKMSNIANGNQTNDSSLDTLSTDAIDENASKTNQELAISKNRVEPIAVFSLKTSDLQGQDYSPLSAAIIQTFLEDRISLEFSAAVFEKMLVSNEKELTQLDGKLLQQTGSSQNLINQLRAIFDLLRTTNQSLSLQSSREGISSIAKKTIADLCNAEPLLSEFAASVDPVSLLEKFCDEKSVKNLSSKSRTAVLTQLLQFVGRVLSKGYTPALLGDPVVSIPAGQFSVTSSPTTPGGQKYHADLSVLSMQTQPAVSFVYGLNEKSYILHDFYKGLVKLPANRRSLALVTMLSNEYALSAGLGRLAATPLGNRFGSNSQDYVSTFLGVSGLQDASTETSQPASLADYFVVASDGSNRTQDKNRVLLFDGSGVKETQTVHNSFAVFMRSTARNPLKNKMKLFDDAVIRANTSFEEGLKFYKKLHLRDQDLDLLTPRGLYTRLLDELSSPLAQLAAGKGTGKSLDIVELAVLRSVSQSKNYAYDGSNENVMKRYLLALMSSKAALKLNSKNFKQTQTDAVAGKKDAKSTSTTVTVTEGSTAKTFTIDTIQNAQKSSTLITDFANDVIRFSSDDVKLLNKKVTDFRDVSVTLSLNNLGKSIIPVPKANEIVIAKTVESFFDQIYESETSIINRLVNVFIDLHEETKKMSKTESGNATWLTSSRLTRNSQLDGALSLSILFEAMLDLISMFVDAQVRRTKDSYDYLVPADFAIIAQVGTASQNSTASKAVQLLVQGSKSNDFETLKSPDGLLPDLDNRSTDTIVTALSSTSSQSFLSLQSYFVELVRERDFPLVALSSAAAAISYTYQQTRKLSDLAAMFRNEKEPSDQAKSLRNFAQNELGKRFLESVTDYSLDLAQERLDRFNLALSHSSKRLERISSGEVACLLQIFNEIGSRSTDNLIFCSVGFPGDFISETLLPSFSLSGGYQSDIDEMIATLSFEQDGVFDDIAYEKVTRDFFVVRLFGLGTFSVFEKNPPMSVTDIVNRVSLSNGMTGKQLIDKHADPVRCRDILTNEIYSCLVKKALSVLSTADMTEENLVKLDYEKRAPGSRDLARRICGATKLSDGTFDQAFLTEGGVTKIIESELKRLTVPSVKKTATGQTYEPATIDLGTAELFYDIFDSAYFYDGLIEERVFSPSYFDKVIGAVFSSSEFKTLSNKSTESVKGGKKINSDNQFDAGLLAADTTQSTISIMSYSAKVTPGQSLVTKQ